jgi:hypothetical protein
VSSSMYTNTSALKITAKKLNGDPVILHIPAHRAMVGADRVLRVFTARLPSGALVNYSLLGPKDHKTYDMVEQMGKLLMTFGLMEAEKRAFPASGLSTPRRVMLFSGKATTNEKIVNFVASYAREGFIRFLTPYDYRYYNLDTKLPEFWQPLLVSRDDPLAPLGSV